MFLFVFQGDIILEWNNVMLNANAHDHTLMNPEQAGPVLTARAFAIVSAAMYDAYNSIWSYGEPYLVAIPHMGGADSNAAVAQAAYQTLVALYPRQKEIFKTALSETMQRIADGSCKDNGIAVGAEVAQKVLAARAEDGADLINMPAYVENHEPGFHARDPLHETQGYVFCRPFYLSMHILFDLGFMLLVL
jgi:hypothetical protein